MFSGQLEVQGRIGSESVAHSLASAKMSIILR
jgi:hypothetical protein